VNRLLIPAFLALAFHALLFSFDLGRAREKTASFSAAELITITLDHYEIPVPIVEPRVTEGVHPEEGVLPEEEPPSSPKVTNEKPLKPETSQKPSIRREEKIQRPQKGQQAGSATEAPLDQPEPRDEVALIPQNQIPTNQDIVTSPGTNRVASLPIREAIPVYRSNPPPEYPAIARRRGYEGIVLVEVLVSREGRVQELRLSQSSGYSMLDQAAMASMKRWLFEPATINEEKVEMWVKVPVRFRLE
jgi:protein TonB